MKPNAVFAAADICRVAVLSLVLSCAPELLAQGPLTPPGAPAPTMKTLEQIEPRTPITNLPHAITMPGAYYLVTNLTGTAGQNGITIIADNVSVDMAGFVLQGVDGSIDGITGGSQDSLEIRNGVVRGWGGIGINIPNSRNSRFTDLAVSDNASAGINVGFHSVITRCNTFATRIGINAKSGSVVRSSVGASNTAFGIRVLGDSVVADCTAHDNLGEGFALNNNSVISGSVALRNGTHGIHGNDGCVVRNCVASGNDANGIEVGASSVVVDSTARNNGGAGIAGGYRSRVDGCVAVSNDQEGFKLTNVCIVRDCLASQNGSDGIKVEGDSLVQGNLSTSHISGAGLRVTAGSNRIEANQLNNNDIGLLVEGMGNLVARNSASGNSPNYSIGGSNSVGQVENVIAAGGTITITNSSPWANFRY